MGLRDRKVKERVGLRAVRGQLSGESRTGNALKQMLLHLRRGSGKSSLPRGRVSVLGAPYSSFYSSRLSAPALVSSSRK